MSNLGKAAVILWIVALGIWIAGVAGLNIYHHLELPVINKYRIVTTEKFTLSPPFFHKHTDIMLEDRVRNTLWYEDVAKILREAKEGDTITFHLYGYGGNVDTATLLINNIKASKAFITMSVEAPVYSAHAYLAVSGDKLVMSDLSFLKFHFSSILNLDCSKKTGTDRGTSNKLHCDMLKENNILVGIKMLESIDILTKEEKKAILTGYDVYLQSDEVNRRINNVQ